MLSGILASIDRLSLALIVGGGVMMAAGVRPLLLPILAQRDSTALAATIEGISINAWNRYNRYAFLATGTLAAIDIVRIFADRD